MTSLTYHRLRAVAGRPAAAPLASLVAGAIGAAYLWGTDPHEHGHWLPRCPLNWATGLLCPACGATRMVYDLMHGDLTAAFHDNRLLLLASPVGLYLYGRWVFEGLKGRAYHPKLHKYGQMAVLATALAWGIVRNAV